MSCKTNNTNVAIRLFALAIGGALLIPSANGSAQNSGVTQRKRGSMVSAPARSPVADAVQATPADKTVDLLMRQRKLKKLPEQKKLDKARAAALDAESQIKRKWDALGGSLGAPVDASANGLISSGTGFYRAYSNNARIYYRHLQHPFAVYGAIGDKYTALGGPTSWLGWPTSDEQPFTEGGRVSTFEHGAIYWWDGAGAIDLGDIVLRYTGLYCFGETDNDQSSSGDEPYLVMGVIPTPPMAPSTLRTRIYDDVDGGDSREDNIELYRGPPYAVSLTTDLFEHDFGDADKEQQTVSGAVNTAAHTVAAATGAIPVVGPAIAVAAEIAWQEVGDDVTEAVNDALDLDDDHLDVHSFVISAKQIVTLARAGRANLKGIVWQLDSPLLSGDGASYKAYFVIDEVGH